jgi:hypothetical protein
MTERGRNPETDIQNEILIVINTYATQAGLRAYRINNGAVYDNARGIYRKPGQFAAAGISDILILARGGKVIFLEVKTPTGQLTESQETFKAMCAIADVPYEVARCREDALAILRKYGIIGGELDGIGK